MAKYHGKDAALYLGGYDISAISVGVTPNQEKEFLQYAVMDGTSAYHSAPGLAKDALALDGLFDDAYTTVLTNLLASATGYQALVALGSAQSSRALACDAVRVQRMPVTVTVKDINKVSVEFVADNLPFDECILLQPFATKTTTAAGIAVDETSASSAGYVAYLQITNLGVDDTLVVKIQHSTDNFSTSIVDLVSFTLLNGGTAIRTTERKTATGAVNRYVRAYWTFGGSSPYTGSFVVAWKRL